MLGIVEKNITFFYDTLVVKDDSNPPNVFNDGKSTVYTKNYGESHKLAYRRSKL